MDRSNPNRVREYRERVEMTQQALADQIGAGRVTINRIEHGRQVPTLDIASRIAGALGASLDELFADEPRELPHEAYRRGYRAGKREGKRQDAVEAYGQGFKAGRRAGKQAADSLRSKSGVEVDTEAAS